MSSGRRRGGSPCWPTRARSRPRAQLFEAQNPAEIGAPLDAIAVAGIEAVNVLASPQLHAARRLIIERTRDTRLPAIYQFPETAEEGGLLSYGPRILLCFRHVVTLVDKVLRGAKPSDLPIEQPSKFELVVNLKTAIAIGMSIPPDAVAARRRGDRMRRRAPEIRSSPRKRGPRAADCGPGIPRSLLPLPIL